VLVRPSYVRGGRGMEIVYDDATLEGYITRATQLSPEHPVLVDRFLEDAIEIDVERSATARGVHRRNHGAHRGGRHSLRRLGLCATAGHVGPQRHRVGAAKPPRPSRTASEWSGLLNVQYALKDDVLYVLEANPRASRTCVRVQGHRRAAGQSVRAIMLGATIAQLREEGVLAKAGDGAVAPRNAPVAVKGSRLAFQSVRKATARRSTRCSAPR